MRRGRRGRSALLVVHLDDRPEAVTAPLGAAAVGYVVSRTVGTAVVRNRVRRRLRHLVAARTSELPENARFVVRALPASAGASSARLAAALDAALIAVRR